MARQPPCRSAASARPALPAKVCAFLLRETPWLSNRIRSSDGLGGPRARFPSLPTVQTLPFSFSTVQMLPQKERKPPKGPSLASHTMISVQGRAPIAGCADVAVPGDGKVEI